MIGQQVSRFRILELLGRGGMASVWRAHDELLGRDVALKILDESLASTVWARHRFRREAEIAALLEHPAIVPVFEAGESGGIAFMVMKLVNGETLAGRIARRLPPVGEVLNVAATVLDALAYAHGQNVVHRDITPRNIMFTPEGRIYVLDFGLARVLGRGDTTSGLLTGTPAYIAPETLRGEGVDTRGDLYALGVVLYEAFTGALPFRGDNVAALHFECLHGPVSPPSRLRPELSADIDAFVLRLMARERDERFASAKAACVALSRLSGFSGTTANAGEGDGAGPDSLSGGLETDAKSTAPALEAAPISRDAEGLVQGLASGQAHVYLAVLPLELPAGAADASPQHFDLARSLETALRSGLAGLNRIHVIEERSDPGDAEDSRGLARRIGANLLLRTSARFSGTAARISFSLVDPEHQLQLAGGTVEGSTLLVFELEDRLVAAVRGALEVESGAPPRPRSTPPDPAARERFEQALAGLRRFDQESSLDGAIRLLEGLIESEGESALFHATLARAFVAKYRLTAQRIWEARAATSCERAARLEPDSPEAALALADLDAAMGRNAEALEQLDRAQLVRQDDYDALLVRCAALEGLGRGEEAERTCQRAIELRPEDWRGFHMLGVSYFRRARYADSVAPWRRVIALAPDNAGAHRNLGSTFYRLNQFDQAIEAYRRSIDIRPNSMALYNLGVALFHLERWEESVAAFERAVALNPSNPLTWGNLGNAYRWVPGRGERMREALERAVGLLRERLDREPGSGDDWCRISGWLANLGRFDEAAQAVRRTLEIAPDDASCLAGVGHTLLAIGRREEAFDVLRRALQLGYGVEALRRSPDLRGLRDDADFQAMITAAERPGGTGS